MLYPICVITGCVIKGLHCMALYARAGALSFGLMNPLNLTKSTVFKFARFTIFPEDLKL